MEAAREHVDPGTATGFLTRRLSMARFDSIYHFHPEYEITLIQSSAGRILAGDYLGPFGPGHFALLGPNLTHWYYNDPSLEGGGDWSRALLIQFSRQFLGEALLKQPDMGRIEALLRQSARGIVFRPPDRKFEALLESVFPAVGPERVIGLIRLLDEMTRAPQLHVMASPAHASQPMPVGSRRLKRVLDQIHTHYMEPYKLGRLARLAGMSPSAFSRFFHQRMGLTLSRYILLNRLTESARQLVEKPYTISEIAYSVGFNNLTHFNRQFKSWKGMTPSEFRKVLKTTGGNSQPYQDRPGR